LTCGGEEEVAATGGGDDGGGYDVVELAATRADVGRRNESGRGRECCHAGGGRWTTRLEGGAGDAKRRRRYGGRRRWMGSSPAAGATATDGLTLGLAATTARQGAMLRSSRHCGGEVW